MMAQPELHETLEIELLIITNIAVFRAPQWFILHSMLITD